MYEFSVIICKLSIDQAAWKQYMYEYLILGVVGACTVKPAGTRRQLSRDGTKLNRVLSVRVCLF